MGNCLKKQEEGLFATSSKKGVEKVEWLNRIMLRLWPYIDVYVRHMLQDATELEKTVNASLPIALQPFKLSTVDLGDIAPRIEGIKVHDGIRKGEIHIDLDLNFNSNSNFVVSMNKTKAGVKNLSILGTIRVALKPLINRRPLIAGITLFFHNIPDLHFDLTKHAIFLDMPVIKHILDSIIIEHMTNTIVIPNRFPIAITEGVDVSLLQYPRPQGVVRVTVVKAKNLVAANWSITGKGKSDPYVVVRVGVQTEKTNIEFNTLNPCWNETFDMIVDIPFGQQISFIVFDYDAVHTNDMLGKVLGKASMDIDKIWKRGKNKWLKLKGVKHGMIHVKARWLWLANDRLELDRVLKKVPKGSNTALVTCFFTSAYNVPRENRGLREMSTKCKVTVGQTTMESTIKPHTDWEQRFRFLVKNPKFQNLELELIDIPGLANTTIKLKDKVIKGFQPKQNATTQDFMIEKKIGGTTIRLEDILLADHMEVNTYYYYVKIRLFLGILTPNANPKWERQESSLIKKAP